MFIVAFYAPTDYFKAIKEVVSHRKREGNFLNSKPGNFLLWSLPRLKPYKIFFLSTKVLFTQEIVLALKSKFEMENIICRGWIIQFWRATAIKMLSGSHSKIYELSFLHTDWWCHCRIILSFYPTFKIFNKWEKKYFFRQVNLFFRNKTYWFGKC